ncbi:unnamed protein product [Adineta ricciae]|nr:unnamed protein product [Adineta ricciae]
MSINREIYETTVDKEQFQCWNDFIRQMRLKGTFADGTTVAASVMFLRRDIVVHQRGQRPLIFKTSVPGPNDRQIHLAYDRPMLHYHALSSVDSDQLYIDEAECISA